MAIALREHWANPSSLHRPGLAARRVVDHARKQVAGLLRVSPRDIVFTGSGTESIGLAIRGVLCGCSRKSLVTDPIEHAAVRELAARLEGEGVSVFRLAAGDHGVLDLDDLAAILEREPIGLVSVQWANNETGVVQDVARIHELCRAAGVPFHCDATQWVGKMPMPEGGPPCDLLTCSAHKFCGPKGVGMLWVRRGVACVSQILGSQEQGRRGGTENVAGIAGAGVAAEESDAWLRDPSNRERQARVRDRFEREVLARCPGAVVNGPCHWGQSPTEGAWKLWNTANIGFPGVEGDALMLVLAEAGVCASAGSACSSGSLAASPVLCAMGVCEEVAEASIRFSIGRQTSEADVVEAATLVAACIAKWDAPACAGRPG